MGFFSRIFRPVTSFINNPVRAITRLPQTIAGIAQTVINDPVRGSLAVLSGGTSELVRELPVVGNIYSQGVTLASTGYKTAANIYTGGLYGQVSDIGNAVTSSISGGNKMGFNFGGLLQQVGNAFGGNKNPYFQGISDIARLGSNFLPQNSYVQGFPQSYQGGQNLSAVPQIAGPAMRALPSIGRSLFRRFPNLAAGMNALRLTGKNIKRGQLYSMMRRFGPEFLVTAGILSAAAVSELSMAGPGRRRMNSANSKALRRAATRIRSFHKLCQVTDILKSRNVRPFCAAVHS